ncbi:MAG: radical SAM protein [Desulfomonile tiedjei]|nr:radical SAM protein [Desulfomonile tiedjei]
MNYVERVSGANFNLWPAKAPVLGHLDIELTERCNNNCIHCCINLPEHDRSALERELDTAAVKGILKEAASLGALEVRFTGGEPLLRPDFEELYLFARRLGLKVLLFTNGRLLTSRLVDLFARIPPLVPLEITVYGMAADSYDPVSRVKGSFAQFQQGVELLRERNVPFVVKSVVLPPNRHEMDEFESWAAELPWMDGSPGYAVFLDKRNRRDDPKKDAQILALRLSPIEALAVKTRNPKQYRKGMSEFSRKFFGPPGDKLFGCGAGNACCVDAYGRLQACLGLRAPELTYDLSHGSLREAVTDFFPRLRDMRASNQHYLERCARCFLKSLCEQCPAKSWSETGRLDTPVDWLCLSAHAEAHWLGLIGPQEYAWEVRDWQSRIEQAFGC